MEKFTGDKVICNNCGETINPYDKVCGYCGCNMPLCRNNFPTNLGRTSKNEWFTMAGDLNHIDGNKSVLEVGETGTNEYVGNGMIGRNVPSGSISHGMRSTEIDSVEWTNIKKEQPDSVNASGTKVKKGKHIAILAATACAILIVCVVCLFVNNRPEEGNVQMLNTVTNEMDEIVEEYVDAEGYVSPEDACEIVEEIYAVAEDHEKVDYVEKQDFGIYMILENGVGLHYTLPIPGIMSGDGDISIYSYQPYYECFCEEENDGNPMINAMEHVEYPNEAVNSLQHLPITRSKAETLYDEEVTLENIKNMMGNSVIIWIGHGGYSKEYGAVLLTYIEYTEEFHEKHAEDFEEHRLEVAGYHGGARRVCVTAKFFEYYLKDNALTNSIIYLGSCHSGQDNKLVNSFLNKGAVTVYCNSDAVFQSYNNSMCYKIMESIGKGSTTGEALTIAREKYGEFDNTLWGLVSRQVRVYCWGDENFTLQKMNQILDEERMQATEICGYWNMFTVEEENTHVIWDVELQPDGYAHVALGWPESEYAGAYIGKWSVIQVNETEYLVSLDLVGSSDSSEEPRSVRAVLMVVVDDGGIVFEKIWGDDLCIVYGSKYERDLDYMTWLEREGIY